jgi:hypothetical protein
VFPQYLKTSPKKTIRSHGQCFGLSHCTKCESGLAGLLIETRLPGGISEPAQQINYYDSPKRTELTAREQPRRTAG